MIDGLIAGIVDIYLQTQTDNGLNSRPGQIEDEMHIPGQRNVDGWHTWMPTPGRVTDE